MEMCGVTALKPHSNQKLFVLCWSILCETGLINGKSIDNCCLYLIQLCLNASVFRTERVPSLTSMSTFICPTIRRQWTFS